MLVAAGVRIRAPGAARRRRSGWSLLLAIVIEPYRMARLTGFLNPTGDPSGAGFQAIQAKIALGSGGIFGVGLGQSLQKAFYLPEAHTDMIAAVIGEELGLAGLSMLVGLFGLFAYAGLRTAQRARDRYGKLLAAGLTSLVLVQAIVNLFAVLGLAPLTGVPLPFVSYGNSSLLVDARRHRAAPQRRPREAAAAAPARRGAGAARLRAIDGGRAGVAPPAAERSAPAVPRVVIAAGGTAGHVVPALAVADALRDSGAEVSFLGTRDRLEAELVPAAGYEIDFLRLAGPRPRRAAEGGVGGRAGGRGGAGARGGAAAPRGRRR